MAEKMTLEQVRYVAGSIRAAWCKKPEVCAARCDEAANMLEALAHLTQPAQAVDDAMVERAMSAKHGPWMVCQLFENPAYAADILRTALEASIGAKP